LVDGATMPRDEDLPSEIQGLAKHHAFDISDRRWEDDVGQLIRVIERAIHPPLQFKRNIITGIALAVVLVTAIGLFINDRRRAANNADGTPTSIPSPVVTATASPAATLTPETAHKERQGGSFEPRPTASPNITQETKQASAAPTLTIPWELIENAAKDQFPGRHIGGVIKGGEANCNTGVCRQTVKVILPNTQGGTRQEPVIVTYQRRSEHWQVTAIRQNQ